jgi:hypothetical protein
LVAPTGIASGVDDAQQQQCADAVNPRIGDHGSRCGAPGIPACVHPTPCAAVVNRPPS